jgi:AbrB family looped-hinge helix DNA binding protein
MKIAESRLTAQVQLSVPAKVRRKLALAPGSTLVWEERGNEVVVRRSGAFSFADIRAALFGDERPAKRSKAEIKAAIRARMKRKHARR